MCSGGTNFFWISPSSFNILFIFNLFTFHNFCIYLLLFDLLLFLIIIPLLLIHLNFVLFLFVHLSSNSFIFFTSSSYSSVYNYITFRFHSSFILLRLFILLPPLHPSILLIYFINYLYLLSQQILIRLLSTIFSLIFHNTLDSLISVVVWLLIL